jgi:hypothetical protein
LEINQKIGRLQVFKVLGAGKLSSHKEQREKPNSWKDSQLGEMLARMYWPGIASSI